MKLFIFKRVPDVDVCCQPNKNCHQLNVFISFVKGREGGRGERNFQGSMLVQRHYHGIRLSSGKSPTNFLASFPNSSSAVELRLNGSQFIPGFFSFNLLILLSLEINFKHFFVVVVVVGSLCDQMVWILFNFL